MDETWNFTCVPLLQHFCFLAYRVDLQQDGDRSFNDNCGHQTDGTDVESDSEADALAEADAVDDEDDDGQDACPRKSGLDDDEAEGTSTRTSKRSRYAARMMMTTRMPQQQEEEGSN